jgi:phosphohistidine phosphatase
MASFTDVFSFPAGRGGRRSVYSIRRLHVALACARRADAARKRALTGAIIPDFVPVSGHRKANRPAAMSKNRNMTMAARRILLLRHAKSAWDEPGLEDRERPLAPRGRRAAAVMGVYLRDEDLVPDLVLCSSARRARETWEIAAHELAKPPAVEHDDTLYMVTADRLLKRLKKLPDTVKTVLVVGHEGGVDVLAGWLVGDGAAPLRRRLGEKFPTAALAVIALALEDWGLLAEKSGTLTRFAAPKDLV